MVKDSELMNYQINVTYSYIDVPSNRAAIEIADGDPKEVRQYLEDLGIDFPVDILQITIQ